MADYGTYFQVKTYKMLKSEADENSAPLRFYLLSSSIYV